MNLHELDNYEDFMRGIPGVTVLQCDDPFKGMAGFMAFYDRYKDDGTFCNRHTQADEDKFREFEEVAIVPEVQICKPADVMDVGAQSVGLAVGEEDPDRFQQLQDVKDTVEVCISNPGWVPCDDPKRRRLGFLKPYPLNANTGSLCRMIDLTDLKAVNDDDLKERLEAWRLEWRTKTFREQVAEVMKP